MYCVIWEDQISTTVHGTFKTRDDALEYMHEWAAEILGMTKDELIEEFGSYDVIDDDDGNRFQVSYFVEVKP